MLIAIACLPALIWIYLLLRRYGFWRVSPEIFKGASASGSASGAHASVVAVIPARNEAAAIERSVASLLKQDLRVIVVDDHSEDNTAELLRRTGSRVAVLQGAPLPAGWTGKVWAVAQGVAEAERFRPEFLLLTDADIEHGPGSVADLMRIAESDRYDLVSYMVKLSCETVAEKLLIPAFVFFFFMLYPPAAIRSPRSKIAGAAGGCMLIRTVALQTAGGIAQIRSEVIDDCALARAVKASGGRVWLGLTEKTRSLRRYDSFAEIERMIARTAFNQLRHSWLLLAGTCLGLAITYLLPLALLFSGSLTPALLGVMAWLLMSIAYYPMSRFYGRSILWSMTLPFAAIFYMAATIHSAMQYATGRGGHWKGRNQDLRATNAKAGPST